MNSSSLNYLNKQGGLKVFNVNEKIQKKIIESQIFEPCELHKILKNSIKHILKLKPIFSTFKGISLQKLESQYLKEELRKQGYEIEQLLGGCLDCLKDSAS